MKQVYFILFILFSVNAYARDHEDISAEADTIPFEVGADKRLYVKVKINDNDSCFYRFLVDTGASDGVLNASLPEVLKNADFSGVVTNNGATSSEQIPSTGTDQVLQVGRNRVEGLRFISIAYPPTAWDGVLGLSFLKNFDVVFNYNRKEMYLYASNTAPKGKGKAVDFVYKAGVPIIPVKVVIKEKVHLLHVELDSGSDRIMDINTPYVEQHGLRGSLPCFAVSTIAGTGQEDGRLENVLFDSAEVANVSFPLLPGAFSTLTKGLQSTSEFDGVIGNNLLMRFNQLWNFANHKLYLSVNNYYYSPFYDFLVP